MCAARCVHGWSNNWTPDAMLVTDETGFLKKDAARSRCSGCIPGPTEQIANSPDWGVPSPCQPVISLAWHPDRPRSTVRLRALLERQSPGLPRITLTARRDAATP